MVTVQWEFHLGDGGDGVYMYSGGDLCVVVDCSIVHSSGGSGVVGDSVVLTLWRC